MSAWRPATPFVEAVGAEGARGDVWLAALRETGGNIARASKIFNFSKQRGHALTRRHGLVEAARALRLAAGQPSVGRPISRRIEKGKRKG